MKRDKKGIIFVWGLLLLLLCGQATFAYEEGPVTSGGTFSGRVTLKGTPPPSRIFHLIFSPNPQFCGKISDGKGNRLLKEFWVAPDGSFQNVVVAVVGVEKGKPFDYRPELTIENCRIAPFITPVRNYHSISLINKDSITHDIQAYTLQDNYTFAMFNKPLTPETIAAKEVRLRKGHYIFRTQCGVHDFMQSWGIAVGNPYFAVTGKDGSFTISDIPPGTYSVIVWHPYLPIQATEITVAPNGKVETQFQFDASKVEIPYYNLQRSYRLETALLPEQGVFPTVELQE